MGSCSSISRAPGCHRIEDKGNPIVGRGRVDGSGVARPGCNRRHPAAWRGRNRDGRHGPPVRGPANMDQRAAITGWGRYSPAKVLTNHDLEGMVQTSDTWIRERTGIGVRHIAGPGETTATMSVAAARRALAVAGLAPADLDLVICATTTPDHLLPATACLIGRQLGADRAGAFDLNAACSGFVYGLAVGAQFIQAGTCRRVLVVAG